MSYNIAVIGGGVAGITAAYLLSRRHKISLYEKNGYLGGHTNTILVDDPSGQTAVDTGFIVCNPENYPNFYKLLNQLEVKLRDSEMSFGFFCAETGFKYTGPSVNEAVKQLENFFKPSFIKMIFEQRRFSRLALGDLKKGSLKDLTLGEYLKKIGASVFFIKNYLIPTSAAIWSSSDDNILDFPADAFINFFNNHGMLELHKRPQWQTVIGGSHIYVNSFLKKFDGKIHLNSPIASVRREEGGVRITTQQGAEAFYDKVVFASHADESLMMLSDPSEKELSLLSRWKYHKNSAILHTDITLMPKDRRFWAAWNYRRYEDSDTSKSVTVTYYMNRLQGLRTTRDYFVSLNAEDMVEKSAIIYSTSYTHPYFNPQTVATQAQIKNSNGERGTYFCGSYLRYGFHEDAVISAIDVARKFEIEL
jgi:predicted NAD/FAD-binding protein